MGYLRTALVALTFTAACSQPSVAQVTQSWVANVRGLPMTCTAFDGTRVLIVRNPYLNNVGVAHRFRSGQPTIELNPNVTLQFSATVAQWWFSHECAHHGLPPGMNSEMNADCFAIRQMRNYGIITSYAQLQAFAVELRNLPGSPTGHLPGPLRAQHIANCALT